MDDVEFVEKFYGMFVFSKGIKSTSKTGALTRRERDIGEKEACIEFARKRSLGNMWRGDIRATREKVGRRLSEAEEIVKWGGKGNRNKLG